jgi:hypothetical protein
MTPRKTIPITVGVNAVVTAVIFILVVIFAEPTPYWKFGPSDTFMIVSVRINTWAKYICLLALITIVQVSVVFANELGGPALGFRVYNPDAHTITDFSKNELQFYANAHFMLNGLRGVPMALVSIVQIDIAIWNVLVSELCSFATIRILLNQKKFPEDQDPLQVPDDADDNDTIPLTAVVVDKPTEN